MGINSINDLWEKICEDCKINESISEVGLEAWILDLLPVSTDDGILTLVAKNEYKKKTVDGYYKRILEKACEKVSGLPMTIEVVVRTEEPEKKPIKPQTAEDNYTFDNFIVGPSNDMAHAAAVAVAKKPFLNNYNPLVIYGNSGVGKTHIMTAIKNSITKNFPDKKVIFIRGEQFANELIISFRDQTTDLFHERFRSVDVLLLDDIHFIAGKDRVQEEFFNTFNALYPEKQIVVTSDRPPKDIKTLEERIRSRFESGMLVDIQPPEFETRVSILKAKADQLGLEISDDIYYYIAEQIKSNIRQLEGIIKKLHNYVLVHPNSLSLPMVQRYIRDVVSESLPDPVTVEKIVEEVSRTYNVPSEDIYSRRKRADVAHARQISMYIISKVMKELSTTDIGKKFNRDHSTVIYAVDKMKEELEENEAERKLVEDIIKNVNS